MTKKKKVLTYEAQLKQFQIELEGFRRKIASYTDLSQTTLRDYYPMLLDMDLQQNISRYKWSGLPSYIPQHMIERMLYFRGSVCAYFEGGQLYFLPYSIEGDLNPYGYPTRIRPVAYNGDSIGAKALNTYPNGNENRNAKAVILYDRAPMLNSGGVIGRANYNRDLNEMLSKILVKAENNLDNSVKKAVYEAENEAQVEQLRKDINVAMNSSDPFVVTTSGVTGNGNVFNTGIDNECDKIMQFFSALNNFRCYTQGIKNNGMFEKMERIATGELTGNEYQTNLILETGLQTRKEFLERLKEIYPQYSDVLDKITVEINVDPYESKGGELEDATYSGREGETSKGGLNND